MARSPAPAPTGPVAWPVGAGGGIGSGFFSSVRAARTGPQSVRKTGAEWGRRMHRWAVQEELHMQWALVSVPLGFTCPRNPLLRLRPAGEPALIRESSGSNGSSGSSGSNRPRRPSGSGGFSGYAGYKGRHGRRRSGWAGRRTGHCRAHGPIWADWGYGVDRVARTAGPAGDNRLYWARRGPRSNRTNWANGCPRKLWWSNV